MCSVLGIANAMSGCRFAVVEEQRVDVGAERPAAGRLESQRRPRPRPAVPQSPETGQVRRRSSFVSVFFFVTFCPSAFRLDFTCITRFGTGWIALGLVLPEFSCFLFLVSLAFYWWPSFTGFLLVLSGFTWFYWVIIDCYRVWKSLTGIYLE